MTFVEIEGNTHKDRTLQISNDCTGSPYCCAELWIRKTSNWDDAGTMHLTYAECAQIIAALAEAMKEHAEGNRPL